jgi:hypothetical protein
MMLQTVTNVLQTLVHTNPPRNMTQARDIIDDALATVMHAMQTTVVTTLGSTPGALAFCLRYVFEHAGDCRLAGHCLHL